ncbi:MAG: hypothetical protein AB7N80_05720 [Bdellovibrionales bacterium]
MKLTIGLALALSFTGAAAHASLTTTEKISCISTSYQQFTADKGEQHPIEVVKSMLRATRTKTLQAHAAEYRTTGEQLDQNGQVVYAYSAVRTTTSQELNGGQFKEISDITTTTTFNGSESKTRTSRTENVYQRELDGTKTLVSAMQDGQSLPISGTEFAIEGPDGFSYESYFNNEPETFEVPDGVMTILQTKQVCSIQK